MRSIRKKVKKSKKENKSLRRSYKNKSRTKKTRTPKRSNRIKRSKRSKGVKRSKKSKRIRRNIMKGGSRQAAAEGIHWPIDPIAPLSARISEEAEEERLEKLRAEAKAEREKADTEWEAEVILAQAMMDKKWAQQRPARQAARARVWREAEEVGEDR